MAVNARLQLAGEERDELIRHLKKLEGDAPGQVRQETACIHILVLWSTSSVGVRDWGSESAKVEGASQRVNVREGGRA